MNRRDYNLIAKVLRDHYENVGGEEGEHDKEQVLDLMEKMADVLDDNRQHFDRIRFLRACGHPQFQQNEEESK